VRNVYLGYTPRNHFGLPGSNALVKNLGCQATVFDPSSIMATHLLLVGKWCMACVCECSLCFFSFEARCCAYLERNSTADT
jgi:hypothetical protein